MGAYATDREWSDIMIPQIRGIVGPRLLKPAPFDLDACEATDLLLFKARDMRIAARVRRPGYADRYPFEFTIRAHRESGAETEMSKIIDGFGDWMFYGHADETNTICRWFLIDLHSFRATLIRRPAGLKLNRKDNGDGTHFVAYDVRSFPEHPPLLVASSHDIRAAA